MKRRVLAGIAVGLMLGVVALGVAGGLAGGPAPKPRAWAAPPPTAAPRDGRLHAWRLAGLDLLRPWQDVLYVQRAELGDIRQGLQELRARPSDMALAQDWAARWTTGIKALKAEVAGLGPLPEPPPPPAGIAPDHPEVTRLRHEGEAAAQLVAERQARLEDLAARALALVLRVAHGDKEAAGQLEALALEAEAAETGAMTDVGLTICDLDEPCYASSLGDAALHRARVDLFLAALAKAQGRPVDGKALAGKLRAAAGQAEQAAALMEQYARARPAYPIATEADREMARRLPTQEQDAQRLIHRARLARGMADRVAGPFAWTANLESMAERLR